MQGELGQLPVHLWWKEGILRYWDRLCSENMAILLKASTQLSLDMAHTGQCWANKVITIIDNAGFSDSFSIVNAAIRVYRMQLCAHIEID